MSNTPENRTVLVNLNSIEKVKSFINIVPKFDEDLDLVSGRYVIDAKSIMGIFSLDLTKSIDLVIHANTDDRFNEIANALKDYIVTTN